MQYARIQYKLEIVYTAIQYVNCCFVCRYQPQYPVLDSENPFSVPNRLRASVDAFESVYSKGTGSSSSSTSGSVMQTPIPQQVDSKTLDIKEAIFS